MHTNEANLLAIINPVLAPFFFRPGSYVFWVSRALVNWVFFPWDEFHVELQVLDAQYVLLYAGLGFFVLLQKGNSCL